MHQPPAPPPRRGAPPGPRAPAGHAIGRADRGKVTDRLKQALDLVVGQGLDPYVAARKVGYHPRAMRMALGKGHVLAYLRKQRDVFLASARAQNIHFATKLRDKGRNEMARLGAAKLIEAIGDDAATSRGVVSAPGLAIVLIQDRPTAQPKPVTTIEHVPDRSRDDDEPSR